MTTSVAASQDAALVQGVLREVGKRIVGQEYMVERLLIALLTGGHVLLEGVPGLAKTLTVRTLAETVRTSFQRIQFTPDLLPADVVGTQIFDQSSGEFRVKHGPIFANIILADEINRAPADVGAPELRPLIEFGASPRATISLAQAGRAHAFLRGRAFVTPDDVKSIAPDVLRHRVLTSFEADAEGVTSDSIVSRLLAVVESP